MATPAIDLDKLNELFDNQSKIDDIFNSAFNEDFYIGSSKTSDTHDYWGSSSRKSPAKNTEDSLILKTDYQIYNDKHIVPKKKNIAYVILPVILEIAVIIFAIMQFI